jgi:hypothetical protein
MENLQKQIDTIKKIVQKHGTYTHFSGFAAIVAGILWLINEATHFQLQFLDNYRIASWIVITMLIVLISTYLTLREAHQDGYEGLTLPLFSIVDKLIVISIATLVLMYVFYKNNLMLGVPGLMMTMYGVLIFSAKLHLTKSITIFGYLALFGGLFGLLFMQYANIASIIILGFGHIVLGSMLVYSRRHNQ